MLKIASVGTSYSPEKELYVNLWAEQIDANFDAQDITAVEKT